MKQLILILALTIPSLAFAQSSDKFEYLHISQLGDVIEITVQDEKHERFDIKKEKEKFTDDYRPLFKRVTEFEDDGWEVYSSNPNSSGGLAFLMRRKRN